MPLYRFLTRFVLPLTCAVCVAPVWAQEKIAQPVSLTEALQTLPLNWDTSKKGVLLWVLIPNEAEPARLKQGNGFGSIAPPKPMQPERNGVFRVQDIAARFDRHMVSARTVTAFAPTLTTILATRLPAPDFYAGLTRREKLRRLEAKLTEAQWRILGSPAGLGVADLQPAQKKLWASLLPSTFFLTKRRTEDGPLGIGVRIMQPDTPVSLSPAQQAGTRLVLSRHLDWHFVDTKGEMINLGSSVVGEERTEIQTKENLSYLNPQKTLFGASLKEVVPDYAKPSQLAYDSSTLDAGVVLANAKTLGDLINLVKQKTGAALFCDVRYRDLLFQVKGGDQTVRAGDALQAVALAVSGTFRKVDDGKTSAYVLTDDVEGLGTRQARISEWMQAAVMASEAETQKTEIALGKANIGNYIAWAGDEPNEPSGALSQRIEAYRAGKEAPVVPDKLPGNDYSNRNRIGLWVPSTDLPASAQATVRQQSQTYNKRIQEQAATETRFPVENAPIRTDVVQLHVNTRMAFVIPGVGRVDVPLNSDGSYPQDLLPSPDPAAIAALQKSQKPKPVPPFRLTQTGGNLRALLVALPLNKSGVTDAVMAAKAHGFNQLWVELPEAGTKPAFLTETIAEAKAKGMKVQVVVPILRRSANLSPDLPRDHNMVGETMSEWATRRMGRAAPDLHQSDAPFNSYVRRQVAVSQTNASRQKKRGDFLDANDGGVESAILSDLLVLSRTPDLAGIVACDLVSPGSDGYTLPLFFDQGVQSLVEDFGYTPTSRLRFLQETGIDPVDLSPLPGLGGELPRISGLSYGDGEAPRLTLPQMLDYGLAIGEGGTVNGAAVRDLGAKNGLRLWNAFREAQSDLWWNRLQKRYTAASPNVPLLRQNENRRATLREAPIGLSWTGATRTQNRPPDESVPVPSQKSRPALFTFRYDPHPKEAFFEHFGRGAQGFSALLGQYLQPYQSGWDGLVIDLSVLPLDEALPLLQGLPADPNAPVSVINVPLQ